eukprot:CAMPEP_0174247968 /NCGR_PEP_ID=MMETSP0417-20130205/42841_1 /TAXON_ID=242541 /ORGANISM="Mayorella sp, Strain BSH-02190019" /LENGTH=322 /DNA_ID=CAMNT_0015327829 /DNA_START=446 /DNA_END=1412 /DNA_ORIENTATION=-
MLSSVLVTRARVERFSPFYHIFSFGISLLGAALAVVLSLYAPSSSDPTDSTSNTGGKNTTVPLDDEHGRGGIWCWVESRDAPIFRFVLIYGPLLLLTLFCACCYLFTVRMLNTQAGHHRLTCSSFLCYRSGEENREATPIIRSMRIFIAILVFCWSWGLARDIQQLIDPEHPVFWLDCLHAFFAPLQGLLLSLLYLLHGNSWQQICCRCFVSEPDVILATSKIDHAQWVEDEYNRSPSPSYVRRGPGLHTVYDSSASDVGATARPEEEHTALVGAGPSRHRFASYNGEDFSWDSRSKPGYLCLQDRSEHMDKIRFFSPTANQ